MHRQFAALLLILFLFNSCAVHHNSLSNIKDWSFPQNQFDKIFSFSYVDHLLEKTDNKAGARWAKRKNIHVIGIKLVNNTNRTIHGSQVIFTNDGEQIEIMHNNWIAKKVRQRISPLMILFLPAFLIESALWSKDDDEYSGDTDLFITGEVAGKIEQYRKGANFDLRQELLDFQLANKVLKPGEEINGVIGVKSNRNLNNLKASLSDVNFSILSE